MLEKSLDSSKIVAQGEEEEWNEDRDGALAASAGHSKDGSWRPQAWRNLRMDDQQGWLLLTDAAGNGKIGRASWVARKGGQQGEEGGEVGT
jgi:hypothetical protein